MITVSIIRDKNGCITEFTIKGHAGYEETGKDIVCSGVSAVSGTAVIGIERLLKVKPKIDVDSGKGYMRCIIPSDIPQGKMKEVNLILETMTLGLKDISTKYKQFVKVLDKEV